MRATRFPLRLRVRYRTIGKADWQEGKTENISHTGALFRVEAPLPIDTQVEFRLLLPTPEPGSEHPEVSGLGRVVRTVPATGFAVAIEHYDFLPPPVKEISETMSLDETFERR